MASYDFFVPSMISSSNFLLKNVERTTNVRPLLSAGRITCYQGPRHPNSYLSLLFFFFFSAVVLGRGRYGSSHRQFGATDHEASPLAPPLSVSPMVLLIFPVFRFISFRFDFGEAIGKFPTFPFHSSNA